MAAFAVVLGGATGAALYKLLKKPAAGVASNVPASSSPNGITAGSAQPATLSAVEQPVAAIATGASPSAVRCKSCGGNPSMALATPTLPSTRVAGRLPVAPARQVVPTSPEAISAIVTGTGGNRPQAFASYY